MKNRRSKLTTPFIVFSILLFVYLLTFSGFTSTDDEQLFSVLTANLANGRGYFALPLFGNDRLQGTSGGVEPLHSILGIPLIRIADKFGLGKVQVLFLLPAVYTALTAALLVSISEKKGYPARTSLVLGLMYGLGTVAFQYARTNFREPLAALLITTSVIYIEKSVEIDQKKWENTLYPIIGLFFLTLAALTKITTSILIPFLLISFITKKHLLGKENRSKWLFSALSTVGLCILFGIILQFFLPANSLNRFSFRFFDYLRYTLPRLPHDHFWPALAGQLFSPGKGLFIYSPVLLLTMVTPFLKRKKKSEWFIYMGALLALAGVQALIYNDQWWSITWGTRALIPALPLACLAALPALNTGLNTNKKLTRFFIVFLFVISACVQIGRLLTSDPVYANWVVQFTGRSTSAMTQWDLRLAPIIRHWSLAYSGQASDIAWVHIHEKAAALFLLMILFSSAGLLLCVSRLVKNDSKNPILFSIVTCLVLIALILTPITAQFDQRYNKDMVVFQEISIHMCDQTQSDDLVLIDSYLNPFWWYYSNFGCSKSDWVGLPNLHQTAINSELFYPRFTEILKMIQDTLSNGKQIFLIQSPQEKLLTYSEEIEKAGFLVELMTAYPASNIQVFNLR